MIRRALAMIVLTAGTARAGGMVLPLRGVRALERAGALVAGAEDADSLWQNPAGLALLGGPGKQALLFDAAYVYQTVTYAPIDSAGAPQPSVSNLQPGHGVPTLAGALGIGARWVIAGGITAPYGPIHRYAATGPQRHASVDTTGSMYFVVTAGAAYKVNDHLRVGATIQDVVSRLSQTLVTSGCVGTSACDPRDASQDLELSIHQTDYLAPAGSVGVQYSWSRAVTFGAMVQSPTRVSGSGTLTAHLPSATLFDSASISGDRASLAFTLPPSMRAGLEVRPRPELRIEAAIDVELWSVAGAITLAPDHVQVLGLAGGPYAMGPVRIGRHYATSFAPSIGVEWHPRGMMFGAGYAYETAATPAGEVSVLSVDAAKHVIGIGGGYEDAGWQIGGAAGIAILADVEVTPATASVVQQAPLHDPSTTVPVNGGRYQSLYVIGGLRAARRF